MLNKKAFTLIETLAVLVLLSIIMMIGVPAISKLIDVNNKKQFVEDAKRFLAVVENEVERNTEIEYPKEKEVLYFKLKYFNKDDFKKSPYGSKYDEENSYVTLAIKDDNLIFKVCLVTDDYNICGKKNDEITRSSVVKTTAISIPTNTTNIKIPNSDIVIQKEVITSE